MKSIQVVFLVFILHQVLGGAVDNVNDPPQLISQASNAFSIKMYDALKEQEGNLFVSPLSLEILLAMLYLGSKGKVSHEIKTALTLPDSNDTIKQGFKEIIGKAESSEPLEIATKMFAAAGFKIHDSFISDTQNYFYSGIQSVDYIKKPQEAIKIINSFVEEKTHNKITDLIKDVSGDTVLILVNALYFKADWKYSFPPSSPASFYLTQSNTVNVDMMSLSKYFNYKHDNKLGAQILEIPYKGDEYSMLIILPDEIEGLRSVENELGKSNFEDLTNGLNNVKVNLQLPKFKLEKEIKLNQILQKMGMAAMFNPAEADLSGIADGNLYVSKAVQKTFISVDENGTEAAAATAITITLSSLNVGRIIYFIANHPFVFVIRHLPTNTIMFKGRFSTPE